MISNKTNIFNSSKFKLKINDFQNDINNLFNNAESALSSDLSANKARAIASALLPGGLGALGGYGLNELVED